MPFTVGVNLLLNQITSRRVCAIQGHYGTFKTSLAFRLAIELVEKYGYRYIVSNCYSNITDDMRDVVPDDKGRIDTVIILDEAGEFIHSTKDTKGWLAFLRKLNACLLIPTMDSLPSNLTRLEVSRSGNNQALGIDSVTYTISFDGGSTKDDRYNFTWNRPSEIYGLYDTDAYPSDAADIMEWLKMSTAKAAQKLNYGKTAMKYAPASFGFDIGNYQNGSPESQSTSEQVSTVETGGGQVDKLPQVQAAKFDPLSLLERKKTS